MESENEEEIHLQKVVRLATQILKEELGIIEGVRQLTRHLNRNENLEDQDVLFLIGTDSESDHLPVGHARKHWDPKALKEKDREIAEFEADCKNEVFAICKRLIRKYRDTGSSENLDSQTTL